MTSIAAILLAGVLAVAAGTAMAASPGQFAFAGPIGADGDVVTMKWRFGFHFDVRPGAADKVSFSCDGIPESAAAADGSGLKFDAQGLVFVESAAVAVSKQSTPWLYDGKATHTACKAVVTRADGTSDTESAPVTFDASTKAVLLMQLQEAFDYNKKLPRKP